jgi:N-acetylmuramoyl-L-alanine amidase
MRFKTLKYLFNWSILLFVLLMTNLKIVAQEQLNNGSIKTIVIDAGHGGKDPGCHGASAQEKHVCLSMALKLGAMIQKNHPEIKVIYTRDTDVFVELDERAKIANRNNADLFICIHANSATPTVYGVETYVLGLHKTEAQQQIAERENATIYLEEDKGEKYKDFEMTPDAIIARQIQLSVFLNQSISYASKLQDQFKTIGRTDRGVKQAGFLVLYKTTMPSVLIETGFLTNPTEERFLNNDENQTKMANAMFVAFERYKAELEGVVYVPETTVAEVEEVTNVEPKQVESKKMTTNPFENTKTEVKKVEPVKKESVSISNTSQKVVEEMNQTKDKVIFRIQIETSDKKLSLNDPKFKGMEVFEYQQNGLYKYTVGVYVNDFEGAKKYKTKMVQEGYKDAFVVCFLNNERIILEKAIKLAEK